jgi:hypothetical protein
MDHKKQPSPIILNWGIVLKGILGGLSNSIAVMVSSPLDVLKIRFQTQGELSKSKPKAYKGLINGALLIIKEEGIGGLFKGLTISVVREMTYTSTRFALYEPIRRLLHRNSTVEEIPLYSKITSGLISGAISAACFNPTDVLKIRFQADVTGVRYNGILDALNSIVRQEGFINGLYKGVSTTMIRSALLTSAQLASYDHSKYLLIQKYGLGNHIGTHFCASFFAGFITSLVTNPVDVARTRIMNEKVLPGNFPTYNKNAFITMWKIYSTEGISGLYKGFIPSYTRMGTCTIIALVTYEQLRIAFGIPTL